MLSASDIIEPTPASREDLLLAHTAEWVDKMLNGTLTERDLQTLELPYSPQLLLAHRLAAGGTLLACREALESGLGLHIGGGSHHAMPDHGEGFCVFNDIAIAILRLLKDGAICRAMVIDLDVHQGNGTAAIFNQLKNNPHPDPLPVREREPFAPPPMERNPFTPPPREREQSTPSP